MYSYGHFKPGGKNNASRIVNYVTEYNSIYGKKDTCSCQENKYDKNKPGSNNISSRVSYATRISGIINYSKGGKSQYGNVYLGQPLNINYLGRIEGMPGGSGLPPTNKF
jgi:hypothetical protein